MKLEIIQAAMKYHWTTFRSQELYDFYASMFVNILKQFDYDIIDAV